MRTPAQIAGHPIHPMLVTLPIGLWVFSFVCDLIALRSGQPDTWHTVALYTMVGGIVGAVLAAVFGLRDMMSLRDRPVFKTALAHGGLNTAILVLYIVNAWMRASAAATGSTPLVLSLVAIALLLVSGWLGGKMVYLKGVAVHAQPDEIASTDEWRGSSRSASGSGRTATPRFGERAMASERGAHDTDRSARDLDRGGPDIDRR